MLATATTDHGAARLQRAEGEARIAAKARAGRTVLDTLYQRGCGKIRVPRTHGDWLEAVLINTSGGLTGGDVMGWSADAAPGTHLVVTTQACERIYRASSGAARVATSLSVGERARLDWLPQETILFEGSSLERTLEVDMAADAIFLGLETILLGREARGEDALLAAITDRWQIRRAGTLIHAEAARLDAGDGLARQNLALLGEARAYGTLCYIAPDAERRIDSLKAIVAGYPGAGVSRIGDKIVLRALAPTGYHLRKIMMPAIAALAGSGAVPRLWSL